MKGVGQVAGGPVVAAAEGFVRSEGAAGPGGDHLVGRVTAALQTFVDSRVPLLEAAAPALVELVDTLRVTLAGGKRLRPAFAYWGWRGAGGSDGDAIVAAAASLELLQACALVHDDVMDGSDTRRGNPSAHRRFEAKHAELGGAGDAAGFGAGGAILLGDLCLSWTDEMLFASGLDAESLLRAKPVLDVMRTELMAGQYLDLVAQARGGGSVADAMTVVRFKSAKYTVERPLQLGGALAGAGPQLQEGYSAYGLPLGEAFQLRDDLLGVFGDPARTGKPAGDDLREGKRTALVALAVDRARGPQTEVLHRLGDPGLGPDDVADLRQVLTETGAVDEVESMIDRLTAAALTALRATGGRRHVAPRPGGPRRRGDRPVGLRCVASCPAAGRDPARSAARPTRSWSWAPGSPACRARCGWRAPVAP